MRLGVLQKAKDGLRQFEINSKDEGVEQDQSSPEVGVVSLKFRSVGLFRGCF